MTELNYPTGSRLSRVATLAGLGSTEQDTIYVGVHATPVRLQDEEIDFKAVVLGWHLGELLRSFKEPYTHRAIARLPNG